MPDQRIRENAIDLLVQAAIADRAGAHRSPIHARAEAGVTAARDAGFKQQDIHTEADRRYGRWLIDHAGQP